MKKQIGVESHCDSHTGTTANDTDSKVLYLYTVHYTDRKPRLYMKIWYAWDTKMEKHINAGDAGRDKCVRLMRRSQRGPSWGVCSPPCWRSRSPYSGPVFTFALRVFPPTALHPILLNKGTWGSGVKWEWAHEWKGTNWHVVFCEVSAQPLDRWLPFANEHPGLCVSAFLSLSPSLCFSAECSFSSPALCRPGVASGP